MVCTISDNKQVPVNQKKVKKVKKRRTSKMQFCSRKYNKKDSKKVSNII